MKKKYVNGNIIKDEFRGKNPSLEETRSFVGRLLVSDEIKKEILDVLDPETYIGLAPVLAREAVEKYLVFKRGLRGEFLKIL